jgi:GNAT superfamily N-acetyltransferase
VLRAGQPISAAQFAGDDAADTHHFGAFGGGAVVGCLTFLLNSLDGEPAWQLRGMVTDPAFTGRGVGSQLLAFAEQALRSERPDIVLLWCNARVPAAGFYRRLGWRAVSDAFVIDPIGPHVKMVKSLAA